MKIAVITLFCREGFRLNAWKAYYEGYRQDVYRHIIVNNGDPQDTPLLQAQFPDSEVLYCPTCNMMASYNLALDHILRDPQVDAIAQIVNDIKLSDRGLQVLYDFLMEAEKRAMVSPVLLARDSDVIDCYGCTIQPKNLDFIHNDAGKRLRDLTEEERLVSGLPGGVFLAKRSVYERLGYQDEHLEMYADEIDMDLRMAEHGFSLAATSRVQAWHQHEYPPGKRIRSRRSAWLMSRNAVYIARKRQDKISVWNVFFHRCFRGLDEIRSALMHGKGMDYYRFGWSLITGAWAGMRERSE